MEAATTESILLNGTTVEYRLIRSKSAKKLRVRVGPRGVEVLQPAGRNAEEIATFLRDNAVWVSGQLARVDGLRTLRKAKAGRADTILFRGEPTAVRVIRDAQRLGASRVAVRKGCLVITCGHHTSPTRSLENWLRRQARDEIVRHLADITQQLKREPRKVYIMGQRTKWGNCSALGNLSFNWRLIMAPDFVLRYIVAHEATHLAIPDHSQRFWLTLQSLCPELDQARQWLRAHESELLADLGTVISLQEGSS